MNRTFGIAAATLVALTLTVPVAASARQPANPTVRQASSAVAGFHLSLPAPTGQFAVGVRSDWVIDPDRIDSATNQPRALPIRVWYPAQHRSDGPSARYMSPLVTALVEGSLGVPAGMFEIDTHATADARPRSHVKGVILASPGHGLPVATLTGLMTDLASRGYAVVAIDHPHDAAVVEAPDGTPIANDLNGTAAYEAKIPDIGLVLDALPRLVPQAGPDTPVGMFGHSIGGAAAAERMRTDTRLDAGVNLDGSSRGAVVAEGLDRPFGMMLSSIHDLELAHETKEFISNLRGPHPIRRLDILHTGYTDFVVFNPEAAEAEPILGAILEYNQPAGTVDSLAAGRAAMAAQREFLAAFMDCYLVANHGSTAHCEPPSSY
jgi:hypothetical protein